jgi:hypothetical protein
VSGLKFLDTPEIYKIHLVFVGSTQWYHLNPEYRGGLLYLAQSFRVKKNNRSEKSVIRKQNKILGSFM